MKHCPNCKGLMPSDVSNCVRCGFELPPKVARESGVSSDGSRASAGEPVSTQQNWSTIWAQQVKERRAREKRILLFVYLAGLALLGFFAINKAVALPLIVLAAIALGWFLLALPIAYVMTVVWSIWKAVVAYKKSTTAGLFEAGARSVHQLSWTRVIAAVLTSNVFFIASCTGGMIWSRLTRNTAEGRTNIEQGRALDARMRVIAAIPNADNSGVRKVVQIPLGELERFKQDNPNYSFAPPLGSGQLEDASSHSRTEYAIASAGPGKVIVETKFHEDEHHVLARYEATDKDVEPLYTRTSHDMVEFMVDLVIGFPIAILLALTGYILRWRLTQKSVT